MRPNMTTAAVYSRISPTTNNTPKLEKQKGPKSAEVPCLDHWP